MQTMSSDYPIGYQDTNANKLKIIRVYQLCQAVTAPASLQNQPLLRTW